MPDPIPLITKSTGQPSSVALTSNTGGSENLVLSGGGGSGGGGVMDLEERVYNTERDVAGMREDIAHIKTMLETSLPTLATKAQLVGIETSLPTLATKAELASIETRTIKWGVTAVLGGMGLVFAVLKYFSL